MGGFAGPAPRWSFAGAASMFLDSILAKNNESELSTGEVLFGESDVIK